MEVVESDTECLGEIQLGEKVNSHKKFEGKLKKSLKTDPVFAKHAIFATEVSRQQVARSSRQNTQRQNCEKFSKCFSRLKNLHARELQAEPRKFLCTPRDWTFHSQTNRQN